MIQRQQESFMKFFLRFPSPVFELNHLGNVYSKRGFQQQNCSEIFKELKNYLALITEEMRLYTKMLQLKT